jgi:hypothetical protein
MKMMMTMIVTLTLVRKSFIIKHLFYITLDKHTEAFTARIVGYKISSVPNSIAYSQTEDPRNYARSHG